MTLAPFMDDFRPKNPPEKSAEASSRVGTTFAIPHVVAWNLTARCNLACSHCYISAGPWVKTDNDLTLPEFKRMADEVLALSPGAMFVLTGGEPLVRRDLEEIAAYSVSKGATVVVGTNGTGLTTKRIATLKEAGVTGFAVSIDSLEDQVHDEFRHGDGALKHTLASIERLREAELDFIVQTSITRENFHELEAMVAFSAEKGAVSFNLYFLVETGRGSEVKELPPEMNDDALRRLAVLQQEYRGRMMIRSKCQPAYMRHVHDLDPESTLLNYSTRCPCGIQYCRITPDGKVTPCPYLPVVAGDLRQQSFAEVWNSSPVFQNIRGGDLEGKCGSCEYRQICGGCRARAQANTGSYMGPDDSCAYEPTGMIPIIRPSVDVTYGAPLEQSLSWSPGATARMQRIPSFVRAVVSKRVEDYAKRNGATEITEELLDTVRKDMPVDFSKKLPFFSRFKK
jgi:AdoMet-dependent heme synthase